MKSYNEFLESKVATAQNLGVAIEPTTVHKLLKHHQRDIVCWAVRGGRRAIFANFGLGKSLMQLEAVRLTLEQTGGKGLIVCPLGVRQEFKRDAAMIGLDITFIRANDELLQRSIDDGDKSYRIYLTNYESIREGKLDPTQFNVVSLDEAAILRGIGGTKTFRELMGYFEGTSTFRFVATATPSPNDFIELLSYAAFLGIMEISEAKTRWFKRNSEKADQLTIHQGKEKEFWAWVATWAVFLTAPSDLGYDDSGYVLPEIDVRWHELPSDHTLAGHDRSGQGLLIQNAAIGVQNAAKEKRSSLVARINKMLELRAEDPTAHRVIWHDLEAEREAIEAALPECATVFGRQDLEQREQIVIDFSEGKIAELAAKPVMLGSGVNLQHHCSWAIFLGIGFKFADFIQAIHRLRRYLQPHRVRIDLIYTEAEREVRRTLERKWFQHNELVAEMTGIIKEHGLANAAKAYSLSRSMGVERKEKAGEGWRMVNNDCILETQKLGDNSVDLILTSIPFSTQYEYTSCYNDFGNNESNGKFFEQMDFLTPELKRSLKPGRVAVIHVKDRIVPMGISGAGSQTVYPFHAETIAHFQRHGFAYMGMKTVVTDVVRENNQTYRLGWSEQCKDGTKMGWGMPEYLLLFRKPPTDITNAYADDPVIKDKPFCEDAGEPAPFDKRTNWRKPIPGTGYSRGRWQLDAHAFSRSSGDRPLTPEELRSMDHKQLYRAWRDRTINKVYDFAEHVQITEELDNLERLPASFMLLPPHSDHPDVWTDVARMRTLNMMQERKGWQFHLCPMQFDIAERIIEQFSQKGELVLDPFAGIGTVPMCSLKLGRRALGVELNAQYFENACYYAESVQVKTWSPTLFDLLGAAA